MYPRNNATPLPILVGTITQISDGVVQTTGVSVSVSKDSGAFVAGANTPTVEQGEWSYTPSQAETDCNSLRIVLYKTGCYSRSIQVVFTASDSFGYAGHDHSKIANPTANVALTNTSIKSVADAVSANMTQIAGQATSASAPIAFPASVANETTVASRATQTSVDSIPTNPLLTTDTRLNNLNAPIGSIPTNPLLTTDSRLNNLNAPISAIPTNPLLTTDARLNFLDASIATSTNSILGAITGLNNLSAKCNLIGSAVLEAPETGSSVYEFTLVVNDDEGKLVNLDAAPTVTATNSTGTNRSTNLSAVTNPSVGRYRFTYTVASTHPRESLRIECNGTTSTEARYAIWAGAVVDFDQSTVLAQIVSDLALKPTLLQIDSGTMAGNVMLLTQRLSEARAGSLDGVLLAQNFNQRVVHVTGSHNVGADLRESQPNSIHPTSLQTTVYNTLSANLLATSHTSYTTPGTVGKTLNDTNTSLSTLLTRIPAVAAQLIVDLTAMLVGSNSPLVRWTAQALSLAPVGQGSGTGARAVQITVLNSLGAPIQSATVRFSRTGQTFTSQTNASGIALLSLDDATWTVSITASGFSFSPTSLTVSSNINQTYSMVTEGGGLIPSLPGSVTGYWVCLSQLGIAESGVTVNLKVVDFSKRQSGIALDETIRTGVSGSDGVVQFNNLTPGVTYEVWRGSSTKRFQILVPSTATSPLALGNIIGN
jgi:hypothetical protein